MQSMTGFATCSGVIGPYDWTLDLRSVNNKGLDIRLRSPDWLVGVDAALRTAITEKVSRGSIQCSLKVQKNDQAPNRVLDLAKVTQILAMAVQVKQLATNQGVDVAAVSLSDIASLHGIIDAAPDDNEAEGALAEDISSQIAPLVSDFCESRRTEGAALKRILGDALATLQSSLDQCQSIIVERKQEMDANFQAAIERVYTGEIPKERLAQELALLAVKSDVTEELDRLAAHVIAAHELLSLPKPVGRKFDFLMQEFNREANTLCSKSGSKMLTQVGLDMKVTIDQMREQIQNVE